MPEQLVARINSVDARRYAIASGWQRLAGLNGRVAIYNHPTSDLDQLIIPLDANLADYPRRMAEVLTNLAEKEGRPAAQILDDLLLPPSDVLRFRLDEPGSRAGFLPLDQGIDLLTGARKAILATACSVLMPQSFHPRLSRTEAENLIKSSHLGQTERGSFTAVISCPLEDEAELRRARPLIAAFEEQEIDTPRVADGQYAPFTRQVTSLLMRSLARLTAALDADDPTSLLNIEGESAPLSANLCEALLEMQPIGDRSRLCLNATWSRTLAPPASNRLPSSVELRREYFPAIESLASNLRPVQEPEVAYFVGLVDSLHGTPDIDNLVRGEVVLSILNQDETTKARVVLNPNEYQTALQMHGVGGYVSLNGVLMRGTRTHKIVEITKFRALRE